MADFGSVGEGEGRDHEDDAAFRERVLDGVREQAEVIRHGGRRTALELGFFAGLENRVDVLARNFSISSNPRITLKGKS